MVRNALNIVPGRLRPADDAAADGNLVGVVNGRGCGGNCRDRRFCRLVAGVAAALGAGGDARRAKVRAQLREAPAGRRTVWEEFKEVRFEPIIISAH